MAAATTGYSALRVFPEPLAAPCSPHSAPQHVLTEYLNSWNNGDDTAYRCYWVGLFYFVCFFKVLFCFLTWIWWRGGWSCLCRSAISKVMPLCFGIIYGIRLSFHICWGEKPFERLSQSCSGHMLQRFRKNAKNASVFLSLLPCLVAGGRRGRACAVEM